MRRALEAQDAEERWTDEERRALSAHIDEGYQQAARGELVEGAQASREVGSVLIWLALIGKWFVDGPRSPVHVSLPVGLREESKLFLSMPRQKPRFVRHNYRNVSMADVSAHLAFRVNGKPFVQSEVVMLILDDWKVRPEMRNPIRLTLSVDSWVRGRSDIARSKFRRHIVKWDESCIGDVE